MRATMKLGPKLIVSLGLALALILGVFMLFMTRYQRNGAIEQASHLMLTVGQAIVKSMERSMRQGDMASIQEMIEGLAGGDIAGLRIVNWGRTVTQSDKPGEIGSRAGDALIDEAFRTGVPVRTDIVLGVRPVLRQVFPLSNSPQCTGCHRQVAPGAVLGVVDLHVNIEMIGQHISSMTMTMVVWSVVIILLIIGALLLLLQPLVLGPISGLSRAAVAAAAGQALVAVPVKSGDEIGQLAGAFNTMTRNLKDALERNESIVRGIADPMVVVDQDGVVTFMNEPCERLTEHAREDVVG